MKTYNELLHFLFANNEISTKEKTVIEYDFFFKAENAIIRFEIVPKVLKSGDLNYRVYVKTGFKYWSVFSGASKKVLSNFDANKNEQGVLSSFYNANCELEFLLSEDQKIKFSAFYNFRDQYDQPCDFPRQQKFYFRSKRDKENDKIIFDYFSRLQLPEILCKELSKKSATKKMKI